MCASVRVCACACLGRGRLFPMHCHLRDYDSLCSMSCSKQNQCHTLLSLCPSPSCFIYWSCFQTDDACYIALQFYSYNFNVISAVFSLFQSINHPSSIGCCPPSTVDSVIGRIALRSLLLCSLDVFPACPCAGSRVTLFETE